MALLTVLVLVAGLAFAALGGGAVPVPVPQGPSATPGANVAACAGPVAAAVGHMGRRTYDGDRVGLASVYSRYRVAHLQGPG